MKMSQSLHLFLCLDDSKSMDSTWDYLREACRSLIINLYETHQDPQNVKITIVTFNSQYSIDPFVAFSNYLNTIDYQELKDPSKQTIHKMIPFHSGTTNFPKVFRKSFDLLKDDFNDFTNSHFIFVTDGFSKIPKQEINDFMDFLVQGENVIKMIVDLYHCDRQLNYPMQQIQNLFNSSHHHICNLYQQVEVQGLLNHFLSIISED